MGETTEHDFDDESNGICPYCGHIEDGSGNVVFQLAGTGNKTVECACGEFYFVIVVD